MLCCVSVLPRLQLPPCAQSMPLRMRLCTCLCILLCMESFGMLSTAAACCAMLLHCCRCDLMLGSPGDAIQRCSLRSCVHALYIDI